MRLAHHARTARRPLAYFAILVLAGVTALVLSQCKLVDERLTGVATPLKGTPTDCFANCAHAANDLIRAESQRHVNAIHACNGDAACEAAEEIVHENNVNTIQNGRASCESQCHQDGSGAGGR
jgi:hypothetical protein